MFAFVQGYHQASFNCRIHIQIWFFVIVRDIPGGYDRSFKRTGNIKSRLRVNIDNCFEFDSGLIILLVDIAFWHFVDFN